MAAWHQAAAGSPAPTRPRRPGLLDKGRPWRGGQPARNRRRRCASATAGPGGLAPVAAVTAAAAAAAAVTVASGGGGGGSSPPRPTSAPPPALGQRTNSAQAVAATMWGVAPLLLPLPPPPPPALMRAWPADNVKAVHGAERTAEQPAQRRRMGGGGPVAGGPSWALADGGEAVTDVAQRGKTQAPVGVTTGEGRTLAPGGMEHADKVYQNIGNPLA